MKQLLLSAGILISLSINAQIVSFNDANFKANLLGNPAINTNSDTEIQVSEAQAYNGSLDIDNLNISDLTGIEAFTAITFLGCSNNQLTSLDLSQNTALTEIFCFNNQLTSLNLGANTALEAIYCYDNDLTNLDLNQISGLQFLSCGNNQLTTLDITLNTNLISVDCNSNQINSLDVSNNTSMTVLLCGANQLSNLNLSNNTALVWLSCPQNLIASLDVSTNTALTQLHCSANSISTLNVSSNSNLAVINCGANQLTSLDLSNNPNLTNILCGFNQLTSLNVANGNNTNIGELRTPGNDNLTCIQVDDASYSTTNWTGGSFQISPLISFSENCGSTANLEMIEELIQVYPNPTESLLHIESSSTIANLMLLSLKGEILHQTNSNSIDLGTFESGIYILHIETETGLIQKRVSKI